MGWQWGFLPARCCCCFQCLEFVVAPCLPRFDATQTSLQVVTLFLCVCGLEFARKRNVLPPRMGYGPEMTAMVRSTWTIAALLFVVSIELVSADCECGYSSRVDGSTSSSREHVFTELTESNFARRHEEDIQADTDWARQEFNWSAQLARGDYGQMFQAQNVELGNQEESLVLTVGSTLVQEMVPNAEIATRRVDMFWGTFRASIKITNVPGTCTAFFWASSRGG